MELEQQKSLAKLLASKFICRPDVKAIQRPNGEWNPVREPIVMTDLLGHLQGRTSLGHYMLSKDSKVKLFAFDIDLMKQSDKTPTPPLYLPARVDPDAGEWVDWYEGCPRTTWETITTPHIEEFLVYQMRTLANRLAERTFNLLGIPIAVAYSGHKGLHVYGFTGPIPATEAREAAQIVLDDIGIFQLYRGNNFYRVIDTGDPISSFNQLSVEIFPKQGSLDGKDLGNLMRLPCGKHLAASANHPYQAGFIDVRRGYTQLVYRDPIEALTVPDQWAGVL